MAIFKGDNLKNTLQGGSADDSLYGYGDSDVLNGLAGNDTLNGGGGTDTLNGGEGSDTYFINSVCDVINEDSSIATDIDTVKTSVNWTLGANLENLFLISTTAVKGIGNALANTIIGNPINNLLLGAEGDDLLVGGIGVDTLHGGKGNDVLRFNDFSGDSANGGVGINDTLQITGTHQVIDLIKDKIKNVEVIKLADDGQTTLKLNEASVLNLSSDSNTLKVDAKGENTLLMEVGWTNGGIVAGYHIFTKGSAILQVDSAINTINVVPSTYIVSSAATVLTVKNAFTSGVDEISIDFGGQAYRNWGIGSIDLTGFGLEDKLFIARHDGVINSSINVHGILGTGPNSTTYNPSVYRQSLAGSGAQGRYNYADSGAWQKTPGGMAASHATLVSEHVWSQSGSGPNQSGGGIQITGLPVGLANSQLVFV